MLLCIDCNYHKLTVWPPTDLRVVEYHEHTCHHPKMRYVTDPVTGASKGRDCYSARVDSDPCGPDGKLWTAKETG